MFTEKKELRDKLNRALEREQELIEVAARAESRATRAEAENKTLSDKNEALESLNNREVKTKTKELELDERDRLLVHKESIETELQKQVKKLVKEVDEASDKGYKSGYADGTADGIRKGMDLTKDDRKMMAQIAALSAASHVPEATSMIAREVAAGIAKDIQSELPATTGTPNKKTK